MNLTRPLTLRRTAVAGVLALAVSPLAACGSSSNSASDGDTSTPGGTTSSGSSDTSTDSTPGTTSTSSAPSTSTGPISAAEFTQIYSDALDKATTAKVKFTLTGGPASGTGSGVQDFTTTPASSDFTLKLGGQTSRFILVDGASYIGAPDGTYLKVDLANALGGSTSLFDPKTTLDVLQKAITKASDDGEKTVGGQTLHEYTVTLDPSVFLKQFSGTSGTEAQAALPKTLTEDLYLDSEGRPAMAVVDEGSVAGKATVVYSDWGVAADITAPPKSKVQSLPTNLPSSIPSSVPTR